MRRLLGFTFAALMLASATGCSSSSSSPPAAKASSSTTVVLAEQIGHVFVINLENENFATTWGRSSPARYLNETLVPRGKLLRRYYATSHASLGNYITQISGQPSNSSTNGDCVTYSEYAKGKGCVYPASVKTIANQLTAAGRTWKTYQQDMGTPCRHPKIGARDTTLVARTHDMYATRHNPFVYFHSIIDTPACRQNVVDLKQLAADLASASTTPNLVYITPNLCDDGHDARCVDGRPGGLRSADKFLSTLVPEILNSDAYKTDGMLIITIDESAGGRAGCCGQKGHGGGRVGALVLSAAVKPGTTDDTPYNHYALLCSIEDVFGLPHLARANARGLRCFGRDVYDASS